MCPVRGRGGEWGEEVMGTQWDPQGLNCLTRQELRGPNQQRGSGGQFVFLVHSAAWPRGWGVEDRGEVGVGVQAETTEMVS